MSLYNAIFGSTPELESTYLFSLLKLSPDDFGRYRDIFVTSDHIVVHTRNGGGNRDSYFEVFKEMKKHPLYDYDEDDSFDCTYANYYFKHPKKEKDKLKKLAKDTITPAEKWQLLLKGMKGGEET